LGFVGSSQFDAYQINPKNGEILKHNSAALSDGCSGEAILVSSDLLVTLDATRSKLVIIRFQDGEINFQQTSISDVLGGSSGTPVLVSSKLPGVFSVKVNGAVTLIRVTVEAKLEVMDKINSVAAISDAIALSEGQQAFALVQHGDGKIHLTVKLSHDLSGDLLKESIFMDNQRGLVHKVFINSYIRTDRSNGFRALIVMEDHSLLLLQQGAIVWSREDGLASIVDVITSELPVEKEGVSVAKVEENLFEWLKV
jgi:hypothetical protein